MLKHVVERVIQLLLGNFPRHKRPFRQIARNKGLTHSAYGASDQHCAYPFDDSVNINPAPCRNLGERLAHEPLYLVFRYRQDARIDGVVVLRGGRDFR